MSNRDAKNDELIDMLNSYRGKIMRLENELQKHKNYEFMYNDIISSKSWRITSPFRNIMRFVKTTMVYRATKLFGKFIDSLIHDGVTITFYKVQHKLKQSGCTPIAKTDNDFVDIPHGYASEYQDDMKFTGTPDVKVLAFYLPQFHSFPENDSWWGKGFTEWTNTSKAVPLFLGHYQPREPHDDIGYYNLTDPTVIKKQAEMAKKHGIYGFCIYYYWFSGKRLMEKPLDILLDHPEIDINYCLCWANENWTRRWDGQDKEILIAQNYKAEDPINFIHDLKKYIEDRRYIRVHGKPVIIVYNPAAIPEAGKVFKQWKEEALNIGIGEISIWIVIYHTSIKALNLVGIVDKEIEFPPHDMPVTREDVPHTFGAVYDYSRMVRDIIAQRKTRLQDKKVYRGVMMGWDNTARKKNGYYIFDNYDLKIYYDWLVANIDEAKALYDVDERFIFINAWNEWGEGTYLEPDKKYGYANINTTSKAIFNLPFNDIENKPAALKNTIVRKTEGYCPCCRQKTVFLAEDFWLRDHYRCTNCGSIPRQRALMKVLRKCSPDFKTARIHESSPSPEIIARMQSETEHYSFSYFYEDVPCGTLLENGGTNENLEHLTLPDESVDIFITQDVMEHVLAPDKVFREIERVLSPGGVHIFTVPVYLFTNTRARVRLQAGKWVNILPPVYHGNPISGDGSLVTYDWGDDIVSFIDAATHCTKTEVIQFPQSEENYKLGLEADFLQVFITRKCKVKKET